MFKVIYSVIGNAGVFTAVGMHRSPKKAFRAARDLAWDKFERSNSTNWAECFAVITNPYGKIVMQDFASV